MAPDPMVFSAVYYDGLSWGDCAALGGVDGEHYNTLPYDARGDVHEIEIALDPELFGTFCRRGRRRLRDIQASCQAMVKLDRPRGVLRVAGPESSIAAVRAQLASLGGPRRAVPAAVWAELMRTRTMRSTSEAASVARLQQESGCRIHIERSRQEVRLFGPEEGVTRADKLLEEMATSCTEEAVFLENPTPLASNVFHALAHSCGVTLRVQEQHILVLGLKSQVAAAAAELRKYLLDPLKYQSILPPQDKAREDATAEASPSTSATEDGGLTADAREQFGAVTTKMPPAVAQLKQNKAPQKHSEKPLAKPANTEMGRPQFGHCSTCPTCGAGRYCVFCGAATSHPEFMDLASYAAFPAARAGSRRPGGWEGGTGGAGAGGPGSGSGSSKPGTPDSDTQTQPWQQVNYMPTFDSPMPPNSVGGAGRAAMVPTGMVPVCYPANMGMVQNGGGVAGQGQMAVGANPGVMQACMAMVPACMLGGNHNGVAFCAMPTPYCMSESAAGPNQGT